MSLVTDKAAWLAERRSGIGASEAAGILGIHPYMSARSIYLDKLGQLPQEPENDAMRWGNLLEPVIAQEYERRTGNAVLEQQVFMRSEERPYLLATLDGMTAAGHPVEFKTTGIWAKAELGAEGTSDIPEHWIVQAHQQMFVSQTDRVEFAVLVGGQDFRLYEVRRDEEILGGMLPELEQFWLAVETRTPPDRFHRADARIMHLIHPDCEGEIDLDTEVMDLVNDWLAAAAEKRLIEDRREGLKAKILDRLGPFGKGHLPDGRIVTRKIMDVAESTYTRKAYSFTDMRIKKGTPR